jgi:hypothetical protein
MLLPMRPWILLPCLLLASCRPCCAPPPDERIGHAETGVFVACDPSGYTVSNEGDEPRYVVVSSLCTLNTAQVDLGPRNELPDLVLYSSTGTNPAPLSATIAPGAETRVDVDMTTVGHCMDATLAPPGQHDREPVSLISGGPADALRMRLDIHDLGSMDPPRRMDVACKW